MLFFVVWCLFFFFRGGVFFLSFDKCQLLQLSQGKFLKYWIISFILKISKIKKRPVQLMNKQLLFIHTKILLLFTLLPSEIQGHTILMFTLVF